MKTFFFFGLLFKFGQRFFKAEIPSKNFQIRHWVSRGAVALPFFPFSLSPCYPSPKTEMQKTLAFTRNTLSPSVLSHLFVIVLQLFLNLYCLCEIVLCHSVEITSAQKSGLFSNSLPSDTLYKNTTACKSIHITAANNTTAHTNNYKKRNKKQYSGQLTKQFLMNS